MDSFRKVSRNYKGSRAYEEKVWRQAAPTTATSNAHQKLRRGGQEEGYVTESSFVAETDNNSRWRNDMEPTNASVGGQRVDSA
jgi:hypothetical protein